MDFKKKLQLKSILLSNLWQVAPNAPSEVDAALHGALVGITSLGWVSSCFGDEETTKQWEEIPTWAALESSKLNV